MIMCKQIAAILILVSICGAQEPPYPRTAVFHFGRTRQVPAEWYAKFDVSIVRNANLAHAAKIKSISPNHKAFTTQDWNACGFLGNNNPAEWLTFTSKGEEIGIYGGATGRMLNFSNFCKPAPSQNNEIYSVAIARMAVDGAPQTHYDGIATDGFWPTPWEAENRYGDIDLDRNGQNDYNEPGKGKSWVNARWREGISNTISRVNAAIGNRPLILNTGRFHDDPEHPWNLHNGLILENHSLQKDLKWFRNIYQAWMAKARHPHYLIYDSGSGINHKTSFRRMRHNLGLSMMGDGYFGYTDHGLHHYHYYYDEFDLDLGLPAGEVQMLRSTGDNGEAVYVCFFTKGAMIVNAARTAQTVTDSELRTVAGYAGPYHRFRGGQDAINDGLIFMSVLLFGGITSKGYIDGDAIFLVKSPQTVIAEIIVDSDDEGTSPGSEPAGYMGSWIQIGNQDDIDQAWALSYRPENEDYAIASAANNAGNEAIFTPTIGVAGQYEVFEWHGRVIGVTSASNVVYEVSHAGGVNTFTMNQTVNVGHWNSLGKFNFNVGTVGFVRLNGTGGNGQIIADAVKFVPQFTSTSPPAEPPPVEPPPSSKAPVRPAFQFVGNVDTLVAADGKVSLRLRISQPAQYVDGSEMDPALVTGFMLSFVQGEDTKLVVMGRTASQPVSLELKGGPYELRVASRIGDVASDLSTARVMVLQSPEPPMPPLESLQFDIEIEIMVK